MVAGFTSVGMDVLLLGPMPTPAGGDADQVDARRSRRDDFRFAQSVRGQRHQAVRPAGLQAFPTTSRSRSSNCSTNRSTRNWRRAPSLGRARRIDGVHDRYIEFAKRTLPRDLSLRRPARGDRLRQWCGLQVVPEALWELGADVIRSASIPTDSTSTRNCGSTSPEALSRKVREMRADIGIALDGDADRVILVDERGHLVEWRPIARGDRASWKEDGRLAKPGIVATVMSNLGLERFLEGQGIELVRTPVGDRYVLEQMLSRGYNSAASLPATSFCRTTRPRATALSRHCRCSRWCRNFAARCRSLPQVRSACRRS